MNQFLKTTVFAGFLIFVWDSAYSEEKSEPTFKIGALVEVGVSSGNDFNGNEKSDVELATVEISIDSQINDLVSGHILLLYEEYYTPLDVDEATITIKNKDDPVSLVMGQMYVPFGLFKTAMISDPLTLELGETRESALMVSYDNGFYASIYVYNGDTRKATKDDKLDHAGGAIGFKTEKNKFSLDVGYNRISSIADSEVITTVILVDGLTTPDALSDLVSGTAAYAVMKIGMYTFIAEMVSADSKFNSTDLSIGSSGKMRATNYEVDVELSNGIGLAAAIQSTDNVMGYFPRKRRMVSTSYEIAKNTTLAFEYFKDKDYSKADGGTGGSSNAVAIQIAIKM